MAKYRATEQSFINDKIVEKDEIIDYSGEPGSNLEPVSKNSRVGAKVATDSADDLA